ncbi:MAG: discoidin domain-containing protein [Candidatus Riflebacteria bacterium]|nr:discoidin domain-containing protein [Candidatus Riflebacteria bacterium]
MERTHGTSLSVLFLAVLLSLTGSILPIAQAADGYWDLTGTSKVDKSGREDQWVGTTMTLSDGNITYSTSFLGVSPNTYYERIATWAPPPGVLVPGKTLSLTLMVRNGKTKTQFGECGAISAALPEAFLQPADGSPENVRLCREQGEGARSTKVVSGIVPNRIEPGKMEVIVYVNSGGGPGGGEFHYVYTWREGTPPTPTASSRPAPTTTPNLAGDWTLDGHAVSITQEPDGSLIITDPKGQRAKGRLEESGTVIATDREGGPRGTLTNGGNAIRWTDGTVWTRGKPEESGGLGLVNLALGKTASQSSDYSGIGWPAVASYGVDGIKDPAGDPKGIFHTNRDNPPWWQVDLGSVLPLTKIRLFNRVHPDVVDRARTIQVLVSTDGESWTMLHDQGGKSWNTLEVPANGTRARYVRVVLAEVNYLHLLEVEVYGRP